MDVGLAFRARCIPVESGALIIEPVATPVYRLDNLLAQITSNNPHGEVDTEDAVGNEAW